MKVLFVIALSFLIHGCVKFEIKPGDVVSDTVDAGKDLYTTIKRKRDGEEERSYSHSVASETQEGDTAKIASCKKQILSDIKVSSLVLEKILSEATEIDSSSGRRKVICKMVVVVKKSS